MHMGFGTSECEMQLPWGFKMFPRVEWTRVTCNFRGFVFFFRFFLVWASVTCNFHGISRGRSEVWTTRERAYHVALLWSPSGLSKIWILARRYIRLAVSRLSADNSNMRVLAAGGCIFGLTRSWFRL
jgi:hypothetical protein